MEPYKLFCAGKNCGLLGVFHSSEIKPGFADIRKAHQRDIHPGEPAQYGIIGGIYGPRFIVNIPNGIDLK